MRSLLFVPGDRPDRFRKAAESGADAIIFDLEDSVAAGNKAKARDAVSDFLEKAGPALRLVRINPVDSGELPDDLACATRADALMLPKSESAATVRILLDHISPKMSILPIATETPAAIFGLGTYGEVRDRLCGLTWGAEDLPAAIGATASREPDGSYTKPFEMVRALALFGAHAAGTDAIETVYPAIRDERGLAAYAARGARDGFTGMMALHPAQIAIINHAFTPSEADISAARRIVDAFANRPNAGVTVLDGNMIDAPHLLQARKILSRAGIDHE